MIDRGHALPVSQQVRLVGIARSSAYYRARPVSEVDQRLMRRIDELHLEFPFAGARMLARLLRWEDHEVGRRRVRTLMKRMGVEALYCKPSTSRRNAQHKVWPYLLRGMKIERANQAWVTLPRFHVQQIMLRSTRPRSRQGQEILSRCADALDCNSPRSSRRYPDEPALAFRSGPHRFSRLSGT